MEVMILLGKFIKQNVEFLQLIDYFIIYVEYVAHEACYN